MRAPHRWIGLLTVRVFRSAVQFLRHHHPRVDTLSDIPADAAVAAYLHSGQRAGQSDAGIVGCMARRGTSYRFGISFIASRIPAPLVHAYLVSQWPEYRERPEYRGAIAADSSSKPG
jgi:hypothetical protein